MEIVENKALILRTKNPQKYECIPNSVNLGQMSDGVYEVAVHWELDAVRVLRNLGVKNAPSPILGRYNWPGRHQPFLHQRDTAHFLTLHNRAFVFNEPGCVDSETEYLSPTGWVKISEYKSGLVAQYHPNSGAVEFVAPQAFVKKPCASMIRFKTTHGVDQLLSPEHRMLVASNAKNGGTRVVSAADMLAVHDADKRGDARLNLRRAGSSAVSMAHAAIPSTFTFAGGPGVSLTDAQLRLQIAVIADGHFSTSTKRCVVRLKRERKKLRLRELLNAAGISFKERSKDTPSAQGFTAFTFEAPQRLKEFDASWWAASAHQLALVRDEALHWDGTLRSGLKGGAFFSTSKASADFVQFAFASGGVSARLNVDTHRGSPCYVVALRGPARSGLLALRSRVSDSAWVEPSTDGFKYCFTVPSTFLLFRRNGCVFASGNTGKTMSAIWAADYLMNIGRVRKVLVLCPLSIMQSAWHKDIASSAIHRTAVVCHHAESERRIRMVKHGYDFTIVNYDGLPMIVDALKKRGDIDLVVVDECFTAGTRIATPFGEIPIEDVSPGTPVLTSNGVSRTKRLVCKTASELVTLHLSNGRTIQCTPDHPFFTDAGWVVAEDTVGRRLVHAVELPDVREHLPFPDSAMGVVAQERYGHWADLQQILRAEAVPCAEPRGKLLQHHDTRTEGVSPWLSENARAAGSYVEADEVAWAQAESQRRQWARDVGVRTLGVGGASSLLQMELPRSVGEKAARLSYELQARLRVAREEGMAGSGRTFAQLTERASAGFEERSEAGGAWVVRVSRQEFGCEIPVFNLEVEGTPHYIAEGCVVHNCNAYKNPQTKRWKVLNSLLTPDTMLWMMTGTPAAQSPLDAFGLAKLVNPSGVPRFQTAWKDEVMQQLTRFKWIPKPSSRDRVHKALQPAIRYSKKECLDLPPVLTTTREVALTPQQAKYYKIIKIQMLSKVAGETISAVNAAAVVNKLLQISAGAAYTDTGEVVEFDCLPRLQVLMEVIDETPRKVIVFAHYRHSIDTIFAHLNSLGIPCDMIHGGITPTHRSEIFHAFQTKPEPRVLVVQDQSASHGVTLTAADTVVFWGPVMSVETYLQCIARTDRIGQTSDQVTVVHIQGSDIERKMFKQLEGRVADHDLFVKLYEEIVDEGVAQP